VASSWLFYSSVITMMHGPANIKVAFGVGYSFFDRIHWNKADSVRIT